MAVTQARRQPVPLSQSVIPSSVAADVGSFEHLHVTPGTPVAAVFGESSSRSANRKLLCQGGSILREMGV